MPRLLQIDVGNQIPVVKRFSTDWRVCQIVIEAYNVIVGGAGCDKRVDLRMGAVACLAGNFYIKTLLNGGVTLEYRVVAVVAGQFL